MKIYREGALGGLSHHGHLLTIVYDETGKHQRGGGLTVFVDRKQLAYRADLGQIETELPKGRHLLKE